MRRTGLKDPTVETMIERRIPLSKQNYIEMAYPEVPEVWTTEHDSMLPEFLQDSWDSEQDL